VLERCWRAVLEAVTDDPALSPAWTAIGGHSLGGRMASHVAAEGACGVRALVLLGYPLHPAGKPEVLRAAHLPAIRVPTLFVQGTRDPLAPVDQLRPIVDGLPHATLCEIAGADHGFHMPRRLGRSDADVRAEVVAAVVRFLAGIASA
jgi:predicted alpha/beta-hydrolase family hydrolase